ncbi:MAG TPA: S-4TM family putative pore-forming effector [Rhodocyclaceae bacterium]|nr:S-4TM family putative pore-forming effector [Rhodocyclaceae bacterium]HNC60207.1 S-4TM family putative pore-forming effector [Rhodocyclaceae bacterium]HNH11487.1 S-4TM family putative pore-forming effector [Rhodocyclaceae bacterium]
MTPNPSNSIPSKQLLPEHVALLRARFRAYQLVKRIQALFLILTITLPVASVLLVPTYPQIKPYVALMALVLLLLDTTLIERLQKDLMKRGARLQEEFDVKVLGMSWNRFVTGAMVDHEDAHAASAKPLSRTREAELTPWYEPCVGEVPLALGRLICQRTNISYDGRLRRRYGAYLLYGTITTGVALLFAALALDLSFSAMLLTLAVPFTPVLNWALREHRKQLDTVTALANLKAEFERLWDKALAGAEPADLEKGSRQLQDAIYQHRASSPLVFDWVYDFLRKANEDEAHHAAWQLVTQAKAVVSKEAVA